MIVGTIFLITVLFGGGLIDTFFIAELEKGVKEYVVDDARKKELTANIKSAKKSIKSFNKDRKAQFKVYKDINASRATTSEEFDELFRKMRILQSGPERDELVARMVELYRRDAVWLYAFYPKEIFYE